MDALIFSSASSTTGEPSPARSATTIWHRRKEKPTWWEYFRVRRLTSEECFEESGPIGNLGDERSLGAIDKSQSYEYPFPPQDYKLRVGDQVECPVTKQPVGEILELRREANVIVVTPTRPRAPCCCASRPGSFLVWRFTSPAKLRARLRSGLRRSFDKPSWLFRDRLVQARATPAVA
jgi:hypothetical protein